MVFLQAVDDFDLNSKEQRKPFLGLRCELIQPCPQAGYLTCYVVEPLVVREEGGQQTPRSFIAQPMAGH